MFVIFSDYSTQQLSAVNGVPELGSASEEVNVNADLNQRSPVHDLILSSDACPGSSRTGLAIVLAAALVWKALIG